MRPRLPVRIPHRHASTALGVAATLVLAGAGTATALGAGGGKTHLTIHFTRVVGLYTGSSVRVLGVPVGSINSITPEGKTVRVKVTITKKNVRIPTGAQAFIMIPNLVSDRYIQLSPAYSTGPALANGGDIPVTQTHAPVEKDEIEASLDRLDRALGPQGANKSGALSRLLKVGAANLGGNGDQLRQTLSDLATLVSALDDNKTGLTQTVDQLDTFTKTLVQDDSGIRTLYGDLAQVSQQLDADRRALAEALKNLSIATGEVASLVRANRTDLTSDVSSLVDITNILVQEKKSLAELFDSAPLGLMNLSGAYNPATQTLDTRDNVQQLSDPTYLCGVLQAFGIADKNCKVLGTAVPGAVTGGAAKKPAPAAPSAPLPGGSLGQLLGGLLGRAE